VPQVYFEAAILGATSTRALLFSSAWIRTSPRSKTRTERDITGVAIDRSLTSTTTATAFAACISGAVGVASSSKSTCVSAHRHAATSIPFSARLRHPASVIAGTFGATLDGWASADPRSAARASRRLMAARQALRSAPKRLHRLDVASGAIPACCATTIAASRRKPSGRAQRADISRDLRVCPLACAAVTISRPVAPCFAGRSVGKLTTSFNQSR
jgi:hypothetical protein